MALLGPSTDYTDKDFDALRARLRNLIRSTFPDWTDEDTANFGNILVELFSFVGDVLTKYQDNQAAEAFIGRVTQRKNMLALVKLLGFTPTGNTAAQVDLVLTITSGAPAGDVPIAARTRAKTKNIVSPVIFETLAAASFPSGSVGPITITAENATQKQELFTASGTLGQEIALTSTPVIDGSIEVTAGNGDFELVDNFLDSTSIDRHYVVVVDQNDRARLRFGDGRNGALPQGTITVDYKTGGGAGGKVEPNTVQKLEGTFSDSFGNPVVISVNNPVESSGAQNRQTVEQMRIAAPASLRVLTRTVAREDYEINALRVAGVARALMLTSDEDEAIQENHGILYVVPSGGGAPSTAIKDAVLEMITTTYPRTLTFQVDVADPVYLVVDVSTVAWFKTGTNKPAAAALIRSRLARAFAIEHTTQDETDGLTDIGIDFGFNLVDEVGNPNGTIAWSDVFNIVRDTTGVRKIDDGSTGLLLNGTSNDLEIALREFPLLGTVTIIDGDTGNPL